MAVEKEVNGRVITISVSGKLSRSDYDLFVPAIDEEIEQHGQVRLLFDFVGFHGWTMGALFEDTKFAVKHYSAIARIAIVGDKRWEKVMASLCKPFTKAKVRFYDIAEVEVAKSWLREGL
ncbi:hypothetical protein VDG1235_1123 [Verrucomicrobiia bacterium DG1235]|nr:hypothetical protein VDG1235_1123 [Verrucomicrobiae bacterium DG1235]